MLPYQRVAQQPRRPTSGRDRADLAGARSTLPRTAAPCHHDAMLKSVTCPGCGGPISFPEGRHTCFCSYCGAQVRDEARPGEPAPAGPVLGETIAARVERLVIPLVEAGQPLPLAIDFGLSTSRDDQDALHLELVAARDPASPDARTVARATFPIRRRGPRAVPRITLTLVVDPAGAGRLSLAEDGTDNALAVPLAPVAVG
jgi:hypothetical protein